MNAHSRYPRPNPDTGVSEIIGSVLLISLVVIAVGIIAMLLFSQTTPQQIPNINFMTGSDDRNNLYLLHNGGDSLTKGTFVVRVDNSLIDYDILEGGTEWSLGKNIILKNVPSGPHSIAIIYNSTGTGAIVLRSAQSDIVNSTSGKSADSPLMSIYPPVISIPPLMQNVTSGTIIFYREKNAVIPTQSFLKFTITMPNSTINMTPACGTNPVPVGSVVTITQVYSSPQGFRIAGIGNQLWELTADNVSLNIQPSSGTTPCTGQIVVINHTLITGYSGFTSNLSVSTDTSNVFTSLTRYNYKVNTTPQYTSQLISGMNKSQITVNGMSPASAGFFAFYLDNTIKSVYFAGNATRVLQDGILIYP